MNQENAQNAINSAALVTAGIYFYRKLIEPATPSAGSATGRRPRAGLGGAEEATVVGATEQFFGKGEAAPAGRFIVGWGFTFLTLSLVVGASPELAGYFAILIAVGSLLGNGAQVFADVQTQLRADRRPETDTASGLTADPTVNVSFAGHPGAAPTIPTGQGRKTPQSKKAQPRTGTHPRTTIA